MGLQKNKNEQISVGYFCGKHAMGVRKKDIIHFFSVAAYANDVISVGGHKKTHRPTELFTPFEALLYKNCLRGRDVLKVGFISRFQTRVLETWMASIPRTSVSFL